MRGSCSGVPSNSAHPPRKPISTTRSSIRASSSFLEPKSVSNFSIGRVRRNYATHLCFSSFSCTSHFSINVSTRVRSSVSPSVRSSSWSSTESRRFDWERELRYVSPSMSAAATLNIKPSAIKLAPWSMALIKMGGPDSSNDFESTYLVSDSGRTCAGRTASPKIFVLSRISVRYMFCARLMHISLNLGCL